MNKFNFPQNTFINKIISKEKIFKQVSANEKIKQLFTVQVERIRCLHEITANKVNLSPSNAVPKIFIIQVLAKGNELSQVILESIDKAFMVPVIFEVITNEKSYYSASYRRRNEADKSKWVFTGYFNSEAIEAKDERELDLPIVLSMEALYHALLDIIIPHSRRKTESISQMISRIEIVNSKQKQADVLQTKILKEKQFNRKVELNQQYKTLISEIEELLSV